MKIAYLSEFNILDPMARSDHHPKAVGQRERCYQASKALQRSSTTVNYITSLETKEAIVPKLKWRFYQKFLRKNYLSWADPQVGEYYAAQIKTKLNHLGDTDIIVAPDINLIAYLDYPLPIVLWTDSLYTGLIDAYSDYSNLCRESFNHLTMMDRKALSRCQLAIFSSDWAANLAQKHYQLRDHQVEVVPTGTNLELNHTVDNINKIIEARSSQVCKLLFVGADWERKGGDVAIRVVKKLNHLGVNSELTIVGCKPPDHRSLPEFIKVAGFIKKSVPSGQEKLAQFYREAHFLILPTKADCTPATIREASFFGLPSLSTKVGGIPTLIKDDYNGKTFSLEADIAEYCDYVRDVFTNYPQYKELARCSFKEYQSKLSWNVAGEKVVRLLQTCL